jgi:hypothetical protein
LSYKVWVVRIFVAVSALLLFFASTYSFYDWWNIAVNQFVGPLESLLSTIVLLVIAGVLLGFPTESFLSLRRLRFSLKEFIILAILPIIGLVFFAEYWGNPYVTFFDNLPEFIKFVFYYGWGLDISSIWLGLAIGKAFHEHKEPSD